MHVDFLLGKKRRRTINMKRLKLYLDTSVISYLQQEDAPEPKRTKIYESLSKIKYTKLEVRKKCLRLQIGLSRW
jgi:hypothetical protein